MDQVKDAYIMRLVERISEHYRANISNRFIRPALLQLSIDKETWDHIEALTEKFEQYRYQGFHLDELYRQIAASARFVYATRFEIAPTLRHRLGGMGSGGPDKVLRDMAINNFSFNLKLFADMLHDLYVRLAEIDQAASKDKTPLYQQMPELADIGTQLIGA
ncbi:MAG: hypothetical protein FWG46_05000 [Treponema sp.]|nr:hypothetical protein [Treponema sp.]